MFPGRRGRSVRASPIESCRSYGAWLNRGGCDGYKHGAPNGACACSPAMVKWPTLTE